MSNFIKHMSNYWKNYVIVVLVILLVGGAMFGNMSNGRSFAKSLSSNEMSYDTTQSASYSRGGSYYYGDSGFAPEETNRKVIKNADLSLESDDFDLTKNQVKNSVNAHSVIIMNQNENKYQEDYRYVSYSFKVPSDKLDVFLSEVKNYGEIQSFNVYTNDVTGTYADYSDRVERYNEQIVKYKVMLTNYYLYIEVEFQFSLIIDNIEDSFFYLNKQISNIDEDVSYSDVTISVKEKPSVWSEINFLGFKEGFTMFMESLQAGIVFILYVIGFMLPFALIYGVYRLVRRFI